MKINNKKNIFKEMFYFFSYIFLDPFFKSHNLLDYRKAKLVNFFLFLIFFCSSLFVLYTILFKFELKVVLFLVPCTILILGCYFLSRALKYKLASFLSTTILFIGILSASVFIQDKSYYLFVLVLPLMVLSFVVPLYIALLYIFIVAFTILLLPFFFTSIDIKISMTAFFFFITMALIDLSFRKHRDDIDFNDQLKLKKSLDATIFALAYQAELRDRGTGEHLERTQNYVRLIAEELRKFPHYKKYITNEYLTDLIKASMLHDIGKVGISDKILLKKSRLNEKELTEVRKHAEYGVNVIITAKKKVSFKSFFNIAIQITRYHHEKWDGTGYPEGLKGLDIPLSARIMALADVYDALRSQRCYKKSISHDKCVEIIESESGKHFDPDIVQCFLKNNEKFHEISIEYRD